MVPTILIMKEIDEANNLFLEKKFQDAIKKYNIILDNEPDNLIALNNKGYSLSKLKKYSDALVCYDKFLQINPNDKTVLINKISLFRKTGEFHKAVGICDELLKNNPDELIALYHKLRILKKLDRFAESNTICMKLADIYPENGEVLYEMASNFLKLGDEEQFFNLLRKAVNALPNLKNKSKQNKEFEEFFRDERFLNIVSY